MNFDPGFFWQLIVTAFLSGAVYAGVKADLREMRKEYQLHLVYLHNQKEQ